MIIFLLIDVFFCNAQNSEFLIVENFSDDKLKCTNFIKQDNIMQLYNVDFDACNKNLNLQAVCEFKFNTNPFNTTILNTHLSNCNINNAIENNVIFYDFVLTCFEGNINYNYKIGKTIENYQSYENYVFDLIVKNKCYLSYSTSYKFVKYNNVEFKKDNQFIAIEKNNFVVQFGKLQCVDKHNNIVICNDDAICEVDIFHDVILNNYVIGDYNCIFNNDNLYVSRFILKKESENDDKINIFKYNNITIINNYNLEAMYYQKNAIYVENEKNIVNIFFILMLIMLILILIYFVICMIYMICKRNREPSYFETKKYPKYELIHTQYQSFNDENFDELTQNQNQFFHHKNDNHKTHYDNNYTHHDNNYTHHDNNYTHHDNNYTHHDNNYTHHDNNYTYHDNNYTHYDSNYV